MLNVMKAIWRAWKGVAHRIIQAQNWFLMSIVYWFALAPVAILLKLTRRPVVPAEPVPDAEGSYWIRRDEGPITMERAGRMF